MKLSSFSEQETNVKHGTIRKCPDVEPKLAQFKKMANFSAVVKNVDDYVKDKRNRIINCA